MSAYKVVTPQKVVRDTNMPVFMAPTPVSDIRIELQVLRKLLEKKALNVQQHAAWWLREPYIPGRDYVAEITDVAAVNPGADINDVLHALLALRFRTGTQQSQELVSEMDDMHV
jgi:hypothetical protein